jgi:hypothetical protein
LTRSLQLREKMGAKKSFSVIARAFRNSSRRRRLSLQSERSRFIRRFIIISFVIINRRFSITIIVKSDLDKHIAPFFASEISSKEELAKETHKKIYSSTFLLNPAKGSIILRNAPPQSSCRLRSYYRK